MEITEGNRSKRMQLLEIVQKQLHIRFRYRQQPTEKNRKIKQIYNLFPTIIFLHSVLSIKFRHNIFIFSVVD